MATRSNSCTMEVHANVQSCVVTDSKMPQILYISLLKSVSGAVAQWVERWTGHQQVVGSNPTRGKAA